jgi:SNF2 family DNA or RNA helicase
VGAHDLGLWAQLADLGVVDSQADQWVAKARALRDLTELPTPEPSGIVSTLRGYQRQGFHWLAFLWTHGLGGILADDMGLGKTLQVLALVSHARSQGSDPFLVVAPSSVVSAWQSEAARHAPGLRVAAITSSLSRRGARVADLVVDADLVVTTYTLLRLEQEQYAEVAWGGLVLDEAQQVKNHQGKTYRAVRTLDAPFKLAVTGTPFENRLMELWALLSITVPGLYPWPQKFGQQVVGPVEKRRDERALARFRQRIRPFLLRRTKEVVAADLPPKQEQVLELELAGKHQRIYDTHLQKERQKILGLLDDFDQNRVAIFSALTRLRLLALDASLVDPALTGAGSAKLDALVEHLQEIGAEGHRALVFSQFTSYLTMVRDRLDAEGIATCYLDGSTRRRGEVIEEWRRSDAPAFLISLKAGGVGLTLTEADYVFVLDPWWNPAAEAQAVDRAHRIGQQRPVIVYRLVSRGTIEEKVMELKARKAELFAQVIEGDGLMGAGIGVDDIRGLFSAD